MNENNIVEQNLPGTSHENITLTINLEDLFHGRQCHPENDPGLIILYRINVDGNLHDVKERDMAGRAILALEGKDSKSYQLFQNIRRHGEVDFTPVLPDDVIDFSRSGIERFITREIKIMYSFSIGRKEYQTEHAQLTVRQILVDFAKVDPINKTLAKKLGSGFHEYKNLDEIVFLEHCPEFILFDNTPAQVS